MYDPYAELFPSECLKRPYRAPASDESFQEALAVVRLSGHSFHPDDVELVRQCVMGEISEDEMVRQAIIKASARYGVPVPDSI